MENKTEKIAYLFLFSSLLIDFLIHKLSIFTYDTHILHNIMSILLLTSTGLLITRGIYYLRYFGKKNKYIIELVLGLFILISFTSMLYLTKYTTENSFNSLKKIDYKDKKVNSESFAYNNYIFEGKIMEYNNKLFQPTNEDKKARDDIIAIYDNLEVITQGFFNWVGILIVSILFGFLLPINKNSNKA